MLYGRSIATTASTILLCDCLSMEHAVGYEGRVKLSTQVVVLASCLEGLVDVLVRWLWCKGTAVVALRLPAGSAAVLSSDGC